MAMAEFTAVLDRRAAWRVLFRLAVTIIGGFATLFTLLIGPVLWVYTLKYGADGVEGVRKDQARLEDQVKGLSSTVGVLQIQVAAIGSELKVMKSEQTRGLEEIIRRLDPPTARPTIAPPRTANVPIRRTQ